MSNANLHPITLTTDFGTRDAYTGAMKGAILSVSPAARIIDITHEVPPQDVVAGAWTLASAFRYFPSGTVHVAVVDPGVGTERRGVAARAGEWHFVGPDNGVLAWAIEAAGGASHVVELREPRYFRDPVSPTFHGRDVFAPVAAHIASGVPLDALGPRTEALTPLPLHRPVVDDARIVCEVVHVDRFGNAITNLDSATLEHWRRGGVRVRVAGRDLGDLRHTYAGAASGEPLAIIESTGHLEIALRDGSAAATLALIRGSRVEIATQ